MNKSLQTDFDGYYAVGFFYPNNGIWFWGGPNKTKYIYAAKASNETRMELYFDKVKDNIKFAWNIKWIIKAK